MTSAYPSLDILGMKAGETGAKHVEAQGFRIIEGDAPTDDERARFPKLALPMSGAVDVLGVTYVVVPLVNADNNRHSFDSNLRLGNDIDGIRTIVSSLTTPFR